MQFRSTVLLLKCLYTVRCECIDAKARGRNWRPSTIVCLRQVLGLHRGPAGGLTAADLLAATGQTSMADLLRRQQSDG